MKATKRLKPSQREKKRYIVFEIASEEKFSFDEAKDAITANLRKYLGEFGLQKTNVYIIKNTYVPDKNRGILRVSNRSVNDVRESLKMLDSIAGKKVSFRTTGMSGILKKAKKKFLFKK